MVRRWLALLLVSGLAFALLSTSPRAGGQEDVVHPTAGERIDGFATASERPAAGGDRPLPAHASQDDGSELVHAGVRVSAPARAPIGFSMVGFRVPEASQVSFRTSPDGQSWSEWQAAPPLDSDEGPDPTTREAREAHPGRFSEPAWVGEAQWVQTRVTGSGRPEDVTAHVIDTIGASRSLPQRAADALASAWRGREREAHAANQPDVVSRREWGANEAWRNGGPSYAPETRAGFVHHTATTNRYTRQQAPSIVRGIYRYHTRTRGWDDVGYNILVDRFGRIYEGRAGGLHRSVIGAHARGFNAQSFGVSVLGSFDHATPPDAALDAVARITAWKFDVHGINADPAATVVLSSGGSTRYPRGSAARLHTLSGHRDVSSTACPGQRTYQGLPHLRRMVQHYSGQGGGGLLDLDLPLLSGGPGGFPLVVSSPADLATRTVAGLPEARPSRRAARGRPYRRRGPADPARAGRRRCGPSRSCRRS